MVKRQCSSVMNATVFISTVIETEDGIAVTELVRYGGVPIRPVQDK